MTEAGYLCIATSSDLTIYILGHGYGLKQELAIDSLSYSIQTVSPYILTFHDIGDRARLVINLERSRIAIVDVGMLFRNGNRSASYAITVQGPGFEAGAIYKPIRVVSFLISTWRAFPGEPDQRRLGIATLAAINGPHQEQSGLRVRSTPLPEPMESEPSLGRFISYKTDKSGNIYVFLHQL